MSNTKGLICAIALLVVVVGWFCWAIVESKAGTERVNQSIRRVSESLGNVRETYVEMAVENAELKQKAYGYAVEPGIRIDNNITPPFDIDIISDVAIDFTGLKHGVHCATCHRSIKHVCNTRKPPYFGRVKKAKGKGVVTYQK